MKVDYVEEGSALRHFDVELASETLAEEFEKGVTRLRRTVKIPGFRKGKTPKDIIRNRFHSDVLNQAVQDLVEQTLRDALEEREIHPLGDPRISNLESELGKPLRFRASFEVMPKIEAKDYEGLAATEQKTEVTEEQIDAGVDHLREQHARFDPVEDRGAKDGDIVVGDLTETRDGDGDTKTHEGVSLEVGSEAYHPGLHEKLQGAHPGDELKFSVSFAAELDDPERAGKTFSGVFALKELKEKVLPEADDELAKDVGEFDTLADVRAELRKQAEARARNEDEQHLRSQLLEQLVKANPFDAPGMLVDYEVQGRLESAARDLHQRGIDPSQAGIDWNQMRDEQRASAENSVKATLLLDSIVEQENLEETEEALTAEISRAAEALEKSVEAIRAQMMKEGTLERIRSRLRRELAVDFIKLHAKLK